MTRIYFAAMLALALLVGTLVHPVAGLALFAVAAVVPYAPLIVVSAVCLALTWAAPAFAMATTRYFEAQPIVNGGGHGLWFGLFLFAAIALLAVIAARARSLFAGMMIVGICTSAFAADGTAVQVGGLWDTISPYINTALGAVVTGFIGWLSMFAQKTLHVTIEQKHRDALHTAAMTGINLAFSKLNPLIENWSIDAKSAAVAQASNWVIHSVPDAIKYLGITPDSLDKMLESKLGAMIGTPMTTLTVSSTAGAAPTVSTTTTTPQPAPAP